MEDWFEERFEIKFNSINRTIIEDYRNHTSNILISSASQRK